MKVNFITTAIAVVIIGGGLFYAGLKYGESKLASNGTDTIGRYVDSGLSGRRGLRGNGGFTAGEILSKDNNGITIKLRDGGSKIIFVSAETKIMKAAAGSNRDLTVGTSVAIMGSANADGSINADQVQIRPASSTRQ